MTPDRMRRLHGWLTLAWLAASLPILYWFPDSVPVVVFISIYANVVGHWSSWQAARVEAHQADDADVAEVLRAVERLEKNLQAHP